MLKEKNLTVQFLLTATAITCLLVLPFVFFPYNRQHSPFQSERFVWSYIYTTLLLAPFYFAHRYYIIPNILAKKRILIYLLIILSILLAYLAVLYYISVNAKETKEILKSAYASTPYYIYKGPKFFSTGPLAIFLLIFVISGGSLVVSSWFQAEAKKEEISKQQLQTELSLLKSQVNPHFLFNTLNSIYSLALTNSEKTPNSVLKLSKIMRYTLEESKKDMVLLSSEIEFINSYIELQLIRLTNKVKVSFTHNITEGDAYVAPLLFIPFIENAFKYGISTHHLSTISFDIAKHGNQIIFSCVNDILPKNYKIDGTGTGLANTKRRLELLYPNTHQLTIEETTTFHVLLKITL